jgi:hypothetical protein
MDEMTIEEIKKIKPGEKICVLVHEGSLDSAGVSCAFLYELIYGSIEHDKNGHYLISGIRSSNGHIDANLSTFTYRFFRNKKDADEHIKLKLIKMSEACIKESEKWRRAAENLNTVLN